MHTLPSCEKESWNRNERHSTRLIPRAVTESRYCSMKNQTWLDLSISRNWKPDLVMTGAPP